MKYQQRTASNSSNVHARTMNACGCQSWQRQWYFLKQEQHTYLPKPRKLIVFSADVIACFPTEKLILNHQHFKYKIKTMSRRRDEIKWRTGALSMSSGIVGTSCTAAEIPLIWKSRTRNFCLEVFSWSQQPCNNGRTSKGSIERLPKI